MSQISPKRSLPDVGVIVPSGGRGERAGDGPPKQFRAIAGVPMLLRSLEAFLAFDEVREIVVPLPEDYLDQPPAWLAAVLSDRVHTVKGGATRAASVHNGFLALSPSRNIILIHDAARPFVNRDTVWRIIEKVAAGLSAIAATPVRDTLKRSGEEGVILETVDRTGLWQAQTPQGFPRDVLARSYGDMMRSKDTLHATDEASLVEQAGFAVHLVEDSTTNFKVTTREDFALANAIARE